LTVRRSTARSPLPTPLNRWEGTARDARYVTRWTGERRGSVNSRSTVRARDEGGLSVLRLLVSRTSVHRMRGEQRQQRKHEWVARGNVREHCVLTSLCQGEGDVFAGAAVTAIMTTFQDHSCNGKTVERHRDVTHCTEKVCVSRDQQTMFSPARSSRRRRL